MISKNYFPEKFVENEKRDLPAYIIKSQIDFKELPKEFWDPSFTPDKYSYEDVLKILKNTSLANDEVFN